MSRVYWNWSQAASRITRAHRARTRFASPGPHLLAAALLVWLAPISEAMAQEQEKPRVNAIRFHDGAVEGSVAAVCSMGSRGAHDLPEIMGGGVALFDCDGDGLLDLFLCGLSAIDTDPKRGDGPTPSNCRVFRNQGGRRFQDWTARAGVSWPRFAMGAAVGDFDADGRDDLFVTAWNGHRLYRNQGEGRFVDVTEPAGLDDPEGWSVSAAWADLDQDGDLDLAVARYVQFDRLRPPFCLAPDGRPDYCGPEDFHALGERLYRNDGGGRFTDATRAAGLGRLARPALGVLVANLVGDARPDLFFANDGTPCHLHENLGGLRFREVAVGSGLAVSGSGAPIAGMGVALADLDGDQRDDLAVTNFLDRGTVLFRSLGHGSFQDVSAASGVMAGTRRATGFGIALEDFDNDGWNDLIQLNGHVLDRERLGSPFRMKPSVLSNQGRGVLVSAASTAGEWFQRARLGRGLAWGDLDRDGRVDLVAQSLEEPVGVLWNESVPAHWLDVSFADGTVSTFAPIGAQVTVAAGGRSRTRTVSSGAGYASASSRSLHFGLGSAQVVDALEVIWPNGGRTRRLGVAVDREVVIKPTDRLNE